MKIPVSLAAMLGTMVLVGTGCATHQGSKTYTRGQAQRQLAVYYGTVLRVSAVTIETPPTGIGPAAGAAAGGVVGSTVGHGSGSTIGAVAGAIGGAAVGAVAEKALGTKAGLELEVELDDGRLMVIVQEKDDTFVVGDRIRVIQGPDGTTRVRQ